MNMKENNIDSKWSKSIKKYNNFQSQIPSIRPTEAFQETLSSWKKFDRERVNPGQCAIYSLRSHDHNLHMFQ